MSERCSSTKDTALRQYSGYTMKRAFNAIQADVNATLAPMGLRMVTFSALAVIADNPGLAQSKLAEVLMIERPNLVVVVDELERSDWITRDRSPTDRRAYQLRCTLAGQQLYATAKLAVQDHDARMTAGLNQEEIVALNSALQRIEANGSQRKGGIDVKSNVSGA